MPVVGGGGVGARAVDAGAAAVVVTAGSVVVGGVVVEGVAVEGVVVELVKIGPLAGAESEAESAAPQPLRTSVAKRTRPPRMFGR